MTLILVEHYTRQMIRDNPLALVVFGDNIARTGFGGQAAEARGEPNTVGIPTLWRPGRFFSDADLPMVSEVIDERFDQLARYLASNYYERSSFEHKRGDGDVWWPKAGVGTGLAQLPTKAPRIMAYINGWFAALKAIG